MDEREGKHEDEDEDDASAVEDAEASNFDLTLSSALILLGLIFAFFLPCLPAEPDKGFASCEVDGSDEIGEDKGEPIDPVSTVSLPTRRCGGALVVGVMRDP